MLFNGNWLYDGKSIFVRDDNSGCGSSCGSGGYKKVIDEAISSSEYSSVYGCGSGGCGNTERKIIDHINNKLGCGSRGC